MEPTKVDEILAELDQVFNKIREEKSYKVAGVPSASLKVKCSVCGNDIEFAHVVYNYKTKDMVCFRCFKQTEIKTDEFKDWMSNFEEYSYF